ncbi:MAG: hypothetical protein ACAI25_05560 [Planctomycetota bacterium]
MLNRKNLIPAGITLITVAGLVGCGGGGGGRDGKKTGASVAPITSNPAPVTSRNNPNPPAPVVTPTTPVTGNPDAVVASALLQELDVFDYAKGTQKASIALSGAPTSVAVNGTYAYVAGMNQKISVVDLLTNTVAYEMDATGAGITNLPLIGNTVDGVVKPLCRPTGIAVMPNGTKAFSANLINVTSYDLLGKKAHNSIFSLNLSLSLGGSSGILSAITTSLQNFLAQPLAALGQARVATSNKTCFVTNTVTSNVTVISASDDKVIGYTPVGTLPLGVAAANGKGYVACAISNEIYVLDEKTGNVLSHFAAGQVPVDVTASPTGDKVYVANFIGGDITVIDTATDLPVNTIPAGISLANIFQQLGVSLPASSGGSGIGGFLTSFLSGFLGGSGGTATGVGGLLSGIGPQPVGQILNGLLSAFLGYAGLTQQSLQGMNMPGIGIIGVSVSASGTHVLGANLLFGLSVTDVPMKNVTAPMLLTGQGMGVDAVAAGR